MRTIKMILIVVGVEPSARNHHPHLNTPSYKKLADLNSFLFWQARNLRVFTEAPGSVRPDRYVGDVGGVYTIPLRPQRSSSSSFHLEPHQELSLSLKLCAPIFFAWNLYDSLRDLALESVRKLKKIILLCSRALGEALAAWCVRYSWSSAPRRLAVTW
jgi:hypothetical protein